MKISELVEKLLELKEECGDLDVHYINDHRTPSVEDVEIDHMLPLHLHATPVAYILLS